MDPLSGDPKSKLLRAAWEALSAVRAPNSEILSSLRTVLSNSVPATFEPAPRPYAFAELSAREPIKPTAAHPRAYRGTTEKPPKDKSPQVTDLRPFLCDQFAAQDLIASLSAPDNFYTGRDGSAFHDTLIPDLSPVFIANLYPALRKKTAATVAEAHALFHRFGLERDESLLACVTQLYALSDYTPHWLEITMNFSPRQQAGFMGMLLLTKAYQIDPDLTPELGEIATEIANSPESAYRTYCLLRGLAHGVDSRYLREGFRLNDRCQMSRSFHEIDQSGEFPTETLEPILERIECEGDSDARWKSMNFWTACGKLDGLTALIESRDWSQWRSDIALSLLYFYSCPARLESPSEAKTKWRSAHAHADKTEEILKRIPSEYQSKFLESLREFVWRTECKDWGARSIPDACALLERICRPTFHPSLETSYLWMDFIAYFDISQRESLIGAPDSSFHQMEKSCRTSNAANHVSGGNWALAKIMPAFTLACFLAAPARLFRTGKTLGCLSSEERLEMAKAFAREPWMSHDIGELSDAEAYGWIAAMDRPALAKAIPKELRSHYDGERVLNAPRLAHYHAQMRRQWLRACLEMMEDRIYDRLSRGLPIDELELDDDIRHTLQMQMVADENRKPLRKLLTAHWAGRSDYLMKHPLTIQWLKKHPELDLDLWFSGIPCQQTIAPWGEVTITLERDPIEALKLGTYVGSCLGLGGICAYSAAATVLDINKQVLYARDTKETVVGRQVVGYDEDGKLVGFPVYPHSAPATIRSLFAEYDRDFAAALGARLVRANGDSQYDIAFIVANTWWNDDLDLHATDKPKGSERGVIPSP
ncbi:hypothetical protein CCAX7_21970 [Capsulimonas corticalis]|uniref:Uncharacterized protein n=1 Tax=Capsulimonas corticalis TaxID=2219043 RepID=A0A402D223_9BACT|nr:hypothetical protein [Capsulimonas corticalis]BDI30146.1 hypothetical protein CCAX7_21970 [Capsulimonas corticalis]